MIVDVIFIRSSLQVAEETFCVFNHVAVIAVVLVWFFYGKNMFWLAFVVRLISLVSVQALMSCNWHKKEIRKTLNVLFW